jgi:stage II sporulation protein GA (sporulation sigma-E factor processing peptidase)
MFAKQLGLAYLLSFAVGGLGLALFYLTDLPYALYYLTSEPTNANAGFSWKLPVLCIIGSYVMIRLAVKLTEHITVKRQQVCPVRVFLGESDAVFDALIDTGHCLREPISQYPVIVAEFDYIKSFLPDPLKVLFYENQENDLGRILSGSDPEKREVFFSRIRMIPFTSIGRTNGMLIGFRPDRVALGQGDLEYSEIVIGIYNNRLTRDGRYQGLLGPELFSSR